MPAWDALVQGAPCVSEAYSLSMQGLRTAAARESGASLLDLRTFRVVLGSHIPAFARVTRLSIEGRPEMASEKQGADRISITCTVPRHRHSGRTATIRNPGIPLDPERACKLIDVAWHPVLSQATSVQRFGPWRAE